MQNGQCDSRSTEEEQGRSEDNHWDEQNVEEE